MNWMRASTLTASLLALTLAACGGGGSDDSGGDDDGNGGGDTPLTEAEQDLLRELAVLSAAASAINLVDSGSASPASDSSSQAKASYDEFCTGGGSADGTTGAGLHTFNYFNTQLVVSFINMVFEDCKRTGTQDGAAYAVIFNGIGEFGTTSSQSSPTYRYTVAGTDSAPLEVELTKEATPAFTLGFSGNTETEETDARVTTGSIVSIAYSGGGEQGVIDGDFRFGEGTTPFYVGTSTTSTAFSLDGPYSYSATSCEGSSSTADTLLDLTTADADDDTTYINGGQIKLTFGSPAETATITFSNDGSASYQFESGASGSFTRDQIEESLREDDCGLSPQT